MNLHTVGVKVVKEMRERTAWIDNLSYQKYCELQNLGKTQYAEKMINDCNVLKNKLSNMLKYKNNIELYALSSQQALVVIFKYYYLLTEEEKLYCKQCDKKISKIMREKQKEANKINKERMYRKYKKKGKRRIS